MPPKKKPYSQLSKSAKYYRKNKKARDKKKEYDTAFHATPERRAYRSELNKYNRKKGTYGNGDGKDASHKGGKIKGFEAASKNRGKREKSRLKGSTRRRQRK